MKKLLTLTALLIILVMTGCANTEETVVEVENEHISYFMTGRYLSERFELEREGNNIRIQTIKEVE